MGQADVFGLGDGVPRLRRGLRVTHLGDERLVLDPASGVVHTVRGPAVRALDAVMAGRPTVEPEIVAALVGSGIAEVSGLSRRQALLFAGSASVLVGSALLPTAARASSVAPATVSGSDGVLQTFTLADGSLLYSLTHESNVSGSVTRNLVIGATAKNVELLVVGGGGAGGAGQSGSTVYGGGGGGGEVRYVDLGSVSPSNNFELIVAGQGLTSSGQDTTVNALTVVTTAAVADGGGIGGGVVAAAADGGSGGGGSSSLTAAGSSTTPSSMADDQYGSNGAAGASGQSGGGGGAGSTPPTQGSGSVGGSGGSSKALGDFYDLSGVSVTSQLNLGA